jgi:hypothetical protein
VALSPTTTATVRRSRSMARSTPSPFATAADERV